MANAGGPSGGSDLVSFDTQGLNFVSVEDRLMNVASLVMPTRAQELKRCVDAFAARLEQHALREPLQWFNFYDFWADVDER